MLARITALPLFLHLMGLGALAMLLPASHALAVNAFETARIFFYGALLFGLLTTLIGLASVNYQPRSAARSHLLALFAAFTVLPVMLAVPFYLASSESSFLNAWFEMVSSLTTTGATLYDNPFRLNGSLHFWRATVGWFGGFLMWLTAVAILAPLNLGGFEVQSHSTLVSAGARFSQIAKIATPSERLARFALKLAPIYAVITGTLWVALLLAGEVPLVALSHAMSVVATSGISPIGGLYWADGGVIGEMVIFAFLIFALSRLTFSRGLLGEDRVSLFRDPELRLGLLLVFGVSALLFLRHFIGTFGEDSVFGIASGLRAIWGALFTVLSFLTTTGFESRYWVGATDWAGLSTPGLLLVGLSLIGGGIATTAGGVKLLRIFALFRHSERELERLVHPHSIGGAGEAARRIRRKGAYVAWIFFMLFALSIAGVIVALSLTGVQFETSIILSVAALSTTGPLAEIAAETPISISGLPDLAKFILALAMVLGRLEALALIALFNPEFWRH